MRLLKVLLLSLLRRREEEVQKIEMRKDEENLRRDAFVGVLFWTIYFHKISDYII